MNDEAVYRTAPATQGLFNKQKLGETESDWKTQEEEKGRKKKKEKTQQNKTNKKVHVPKMQHNTTKIFQWIYTIHSFITPYCE